MSAFTRRSHAPPSTGTRPIPTLAPRPPHKRRSYFWFKNSGLQNQYVLYKAHAQGGSAADESKAEVLLDMNTFRKVRGALHAPHSRRPDATPTLCPCAAAAFPKDGTAALRTYAFNKAGTKLAYAVSYSGSDWCTIYVRDVDTCEDHEGESIEWAR